MNAEVNVMSVLIREFPDKKMLCVEKDIPTGIAGLLMAFAISPSGLSALAGWLLAKLDELTGSLRGFITG